MGKRNHPRPSDAELAILRVLWDVGPSTVGQVHAVFSEDKPIGYSTVLKLMQIMSAKGLMERDDRRRTHVYRPKASRTVFITLSSFLCALAPLREPFQDDAGRWLHGAIPRQSRGLKDVGMRAHRPLRALRSV